LVGDVEVTVPEVRHLRPVLLFQYPDPHLVYEGGLAAVLEVVLGLVGFVGPDEVIGYGTVDHAQADLDGGGIVGGAVLADEVLEDVNGDVRPHFDLAHEVLSDDLPSEDVVDFSV
jgi:hypothetical protein